MNRQNPNWLKKKIQQICSTRHDTCSTIFARTTKYYNIRDEQTADLFVFLIFNFFDSERSIFPNELQPFLAPQKHDNILK